MSKYELLWEYINKSNKRYFEIKLYDINQILGFNLDCLYLNYKKELLSHEVKKYIIFIKK